MKSEGCAYGQVTRQMVIDLTKNIREIKSSLDYLNEKLDKSYNHLSNRLPLWASILITFLVTLVGILLTIVLG